MTTPQYEAADRLWDIIARGRVHKIAEIFEEKKPAEIKEIIELDCSTIILTTYKNKRESLNCLHYAAKKGHASAIHELFRVAAADPLNPDVRSAHLGWTPLHFAVFTGHVRAYLALRENGAAVDAQDDSGLTPLHLAVVMGYRKIAALLVNGGASPNVQDNDGLTPLHYCFTKHTGWSDVEREQLVDLLILRGTNLQLQDGEGNSVLHLAVKANSDRGSVDRISKAMKATCGVTITNQLGQMPLHLAMTPNMVDALILYGANRNQQDNEGRTVLHLKVDDVNMVKHLLTKVGVDTNVKDSCGRIALHYAAMNKTPNLEVMKKLIECKSDVNAQDLDGNTPLHLLCDNTYKEFEVQNEKTGECEKQKLDLRKSNDLILLHLIALGANVNLQNGKGETSLHLALRNKAAIKSNILAEHSADPLIEDNQGVTPRELNKNWFGKMERQGTFSNDEPLADSKTKIEAGQMPDWVDGASQPMSTVQGKPPPQFTLERTKTSLFGSPRVASSKGDQTTAKKKGTSNDLSKQMDTLKTGGKEEELDDVTAFLEEFSKQGQTSKKTTADGGTPAQPPSLERQLTSLQGEVQDVTKLLEKLMNEK